MLLAVSAAPQSYLPARFCRLELETSHPMVGLEYFWFPQVSSWNLLPVGAYDSIIQEADMGFGRGALLWLIGIPLPIIILLAIFMHH